MATKSRSVDASAANPKKTPNSLHADYCDASGDVVASCFLITDAPKKLLPMQCAAMSCPCL